MVAKPCALHSFAQGSKSTRPIGLHLMVEDRHTSYLAIHNLNTNPTFPNLNHNLDPILELTPIPNSNPGSDPNPMKYAKIENHTEHESQDPCTPFRCVHAHFDL